MCMYIYTVYMCIISCVKLLFCFGIIVCLRFDWLLVGGCMFVQGFHFDAVVSGWFHFFVFDAHYFEHFFRHEVGLFGRAVMNAHVFESALFMFANFASFRKKVIAKK